MMTALVVLALLQEMPADAKQVVAKAEAKLEALRRAYEESCAQVKAQEARDLQKIHDAIKKGEPAIAGVIKAKIDALSADVAVSAKAKPTVERWIQGKWILKGGNYGEVWEFKDQKVIGTGIGDRIGGKYTIDGGNIQVIWDSGLIEWIRIPEVFSDETTALGRIGPMTAKRTK